MDRETATRLVGIRTSIVSCQRCGLRNIATRPVPFGFPRLPLKSPRIVVVGEAPGKVEDEEGVPFVGPAGRLLRRVLDESGVPTGALVNAVCCFPGHHRTPSRVHLQACGSHLHQQLCLLNPEWIIPVGGTAYQAIRALGDGFASIPDHPISAVHGHPFTLKADLGGREWSEVTVVPTYHPAAALYQPQFEPWIREDMRRLGRWIKGEVADWFHGPCLLCEKDVYMFTGTGAGYCLAHWQGVVAPAFTKMKRKEKLSVPEGQQEMFEEEVIDG